MRVGDPFSHRFVLTNRDLQQPSKEAILRSQRMRLLLFLFVLGAKRKQ